GAPARAAERSERGVRTAGSARRGEGREPLADLTRLLLRHAVQRAEAEHEVAGVDADHRPRRKESGEDGERLPVADVVEGRDEDRRVGDIEVRVARRQPLAAEG